MSCGSVLLQCTRNQRPVYPGLYSVPKVPIKAFFLCFMPYSDEIDSSLLSRDSLKNPLLIRADQADDRSVSNQFLQSGHGKNPLCYGWPGVDTLLSVYT